MCGITDPIVLDFHHRDPSEKKTNVARFGRGGWSLKRIDEEIAKCEVVCANCHRRLHALLV